MAFGMMVVPVSGADVDVCCVGCGSGSFGETWRFIVVSDCPDSVSAQVYRVICTHCGVKGPSSDSPEGALAEYMVQEEKCASIRRQRELRGATCL